MKINLKFKLKGIKRIKKKLYNEKNIGIEQGFLGLPARFYTWDNGISIH